jgi:polyhydroxyalkanoate synthesis repressor PhaR
MEMPNEVGGSGAGGDKPRRVIKRYSNRKLYDTRDSRYVTLQQIGEMVRAGEEVQIIDNKTKEDKTEVTLALILSEDLKNQPRSVPLGALRDLIQERGGRLLTQLREGPIGRFIPGSAEDGDGQELAEGASPPRPEPADEPREGGASVEGRAGGGGDDRPQRGRLSEIVESSKSALDQWQHSVDERIRTILPSTKLVRELQAEIARLTQRVDQLEKHNGLQPPAAPPEGAAGPKE